MRSNRLPSRRSKVSSRPVIVIVACAAAAAAAAAAASCAEGVPELVPVVLVPGLFDPVVLLPVPLAAAALAVVDGGRHDACCCAIAVADDQPRVSTHARMS